MIVGLSLEVFTYCWLVGFIGDATSGESIAPVTSCLFPVVSKRHL